MDLVGRVRRAVAERSVHPEEFERCACALLQVVYPGLSAVEGGHDFGRDADIYFPLSDSDPDNRGRLLVTTGTRWTICAGVFGACRRRTPAPI